jgi:hypothetical protein
MKTRPTFYRKGDIARFREFLNRQDTGDSKHQHRSFRQRTRKYGDYLYNQDRERFMVDITEWLMIANSEHPWQ